MGRGSGGRCHRSRPRGQSFPHCSRLLAVGRGGEGRSGRGAWEEGTGWGRLWPWHARPSLGPQQPQGAQGPAQQWAEVPVAYGPCA